MDFEYIIANNQVTIIKYTGSSKDVTIPNEIENLPVTTIGEESFKNNELTSIILPQNITTIRESAFDTNKLTSINLPQNLTTIEEFAFCENDLTSISLPNKFRTEEQIINIFELDLEEFDNNNKQFVKPYLAKILNDYVHRYFHDIIIDYMIPSNELIQEVMEA